MTMTMTMTSLTLPKTIKTLIDNARKKITDPYIASLIKSPQIVFNFGPIMRTIIDYAVMTDTVESLESVQRVVRMMLYILPEYPMKKKALLSNAVITLACFETGGNMLNYRPGTRIEVIVRDFIKKKGDISAVNCDGRDLRDRIDALETLTAVIGECNKGNKGNKGNKAIENILKAAAPVSIIITLVLLKERVSKEVTGRLNELKHEHEHNEAVADIEENTDLLDMVIDETIVELSNDPDAVIDPKTVLDELTNKDFENITELEHEHNNAVADIEENTDLLDMVIDELSNDPDAVIDPKTVLDLLTYKDFEIFSRYDDDMAGLERALVGQEKSLAGLEKEIANQYNIRKIIVHEADRAETERYIDYLEGHADKLRIQIGYNNESISKKIKYTKMRVSRSTAKHRLIWNRINRIFNFVPKYNTSFFIRLLVRIEIHTLQKERSDLLSNPQENSRYRDERVIVINARLEKLKISLKRLNYYINYYIHQKN